MNSGRLPGALLAMLLLLPAVGCTSVDEGGEGGDASALARTISRRVVPDMQPDQLLGLDPDQLTALLGAADFRRADGPAEIWQYRDETCVLDLFLYAGGTSGTWRVEHVEARDRTVSPTPAGSSSCPTALLRQRRQQAG